MKRIDKTWDEFEKAFWKFMGVRCNVLWQKGYGERTLYALGTDGKRYFASWSKWAWPFQDEEGNYLVPDVNMRDSGDGIVWFDTLDQAVKEMESIIESIGVVDEEWAEETLEELKEIKKEEVQ